MPRAFLLIAFGLAAAGSVLLAQDTAPGQAPLVTLRGVIVSDDVAASPLRRVRVDVSADGLRADPGFTDDQGRFVVSVPRRPHTITFDKAGFVRQQWQRSTASIDERLSIRMIRGAAIAGRVVDEFGDPLLARVQLRRGDWETVIVSDPLGEFRVGSLPSGRYALTVVGGFPSLAQPDPQQQPTLVDIEQGEEVFSSLRASVLGFANGTAAAARLAAKRVAQPGGSRHIGVIRGRVVGPTGLPVGGASVTIARTGEPEQTTVSDGGGLFSFEGLPEGIFRLRAGKLGPSLFADAPDNTVSLREGQVLEQVNLMMVHPPIISGTVIDEYGEPAEGMTVQLWQLRSRGGRMVLVRSDNLTAKGRTDDRGRYRLFASPGTFYVVATDERAVPGSGADSLVRIYHPGTATLAGALPVRSERGRDITAVDITLVPTTGRIRGFAVDAAGRPLIAPVMLRERNWSRLPMPSPRVAAVGPAGEFSFANVPPGDYVIHAIVQPRDGGAAEFGVATITVVDGETRSVTVRSSPGATMTGRIELEGDRRDLDFSKFSLSAESVDGDFINPGSPAPWALVREDATFEWTGLHGSLRIVGNAPGGWWLKSVDVGGLDAANQPYPFGNAGRLENVVAVFADTAAEISGRVVERSNQSVQAYAVLVFPPDRGRWSAVSGYVKVATPDPSGRFRAVTMPPGDYLVAAVDRFDLETEWLDPEILADLVPAARRITLRERQQLTIELDLIRRQP